jgi:hypothetical protein
VDEAAWRRYRREARARAAAQMLLIIAALGIAVAVLTFVAPMAYAAGDVRGELWFRLLSRELFIAVDLLLIVGSIRVLRRNRTMP